MKRWDIAVSVCFTVNTQFSMNVSGMMRISSAFDVVA